MTISMYQASVPVLLQGLKALSKILTKAEAHAAERKIDPQVFLSARLAPDMFPLTRQIQIATDHAKFIPSRLSGQAAPRYEDTEASFADLQARIAKTVQHLESFAPSDIDGADDRTIELKSGTRELSFTGLDYLTKFALPNFYFHYTTAYGILRHNGVPLGKLDFMGAS